MCYGLVVSVWWFIGFGLCFGRMCWLGRCDIVWLCCLVWLLVVGLVFGCLVGCW